MKTITIPEQEYLNMRQTIDQLSVKIGLLQDREFLQKSAFAYQCFHRETDAIKKHARISLKRGSAKDIITYTDDNFDAPLDDFEAYMS